MMKYSDLCWVEFVPETNTYKMGLSEVAHTLLGSISAIEVADQETFERNQQIASVSGILGAIRLLTPMECDGIVNTNTTQLRSLSNRPLSLGPRGGWIVEFVSEDRETFMSLSDIPVDTELFCVDCFSNKG